MIIYFDARLSWREKDLSGDPSQDKSSFLCGFLEPVRRKMCSGEWQQNL